MSQLKSGRDLVARDAEVLLHPASSISALLDNGPQMMWSGQGSTLTDVDGAELLDAIAGLWCVNVGYGRETITDAMKTAADQLAYYHTFSNASNPWQVQLADAILQRAPSTMSKCFFGSSGSDANDTLIKIAWHYHALRGQPGKTKIIAREQAYHGTSISTASLTGLGSFHKAMPLPEPYVLRTLCPHYYTQAKAGESEAAFCQRLIDHVEHLIEEYGADSIAAFFAEPIHAAGGIIEPPKGYYPTLSKLLKAHNILLIADEVVCGFGRLGTWFGSEQFDFVPDMMSCAKGLTSGYFPMSAALMSEPIWQTLLQGSRELGGFAHGYTYSGHPVGCAVGLANLGIIERENLVERAHEVGAYLHDKLHERLGDHANVGEIRGRGMLAGVQLVRDRDRRILPDPADKWPLRVSTRVRELGVIVRPLPSVGTIALSPPLVFSHDEIDRTVDTIAQGIHALV